MPTSLEDFIFLSFLNLSFNQLVGTVPCRRQFQAFSEDSFIGNEGLEKCYRVPVDEYGFEWKPTLYGLNINWNVIFSVIGFSLGFGLVIVSLEYCKRWEEMVFSSCGCHFKIFPHLAPR